MCFQHCTILITTQIQTTLTDYSLYILFSESELFDRRFGDNDIDFDSDLNSVEEPDHTLSDIRYEQ